jgi:hypothetical protein
MKYPKIYRDVVIESMISNVLKESPKSFENIMISIKCPDDLDYRVINILDKMRQRGLISESNGIWYDPTSNP